MATDHIATLKRMENAIHTLLLIGDRPLETAPEDVRAEVEALRAAIALMRGQSDEPFGWWVECNGTDGDFGQFVTDSNFIKTLQSHGVVNKVTALYNSAGCGQSDEGAKDAAAKLLSAARSVVAADLDYSLDAEHIEALDEAADEYEAAMQKEPQP